MFAPVVSRLETFAIPVKRETRDYMSAVLTTPAFIKWQADSAAEKWIVPEDEVD
jgi:glutathione S-transferase